MDEFARTDPVASDVDDRREVFRVQYSKGDRAQILIDGACFDLVDCSGGGLRFRIGEAPPPRLASHVQARVFLACGAVAEVSGVIIRFEGDEVALAFSHERVPTPLLMREQHHLRSRP